MIRRIFAIFLRYFYTISGMHQFVDLFFWPLIDILLWGLTMAWIQQQQTMPHLPLLILSAVILWQIVTRADCDISVNMLQEFWTAAGSTPPAR